VGRRAECGAEIVPLSTAYSVAETFGTESRLDDGVREAPIFYGSYLGTMAVAAAIVLIPSVPLIPVLYLSQALNAILLVPAWCATAMLIACVAALGLVSAT
jgi:hypothetical protein